MLRKIIWREMTSGPPTTVELGNAQEDFGAQSCSRLLRSRGRRGPIFHPLISKLVLVIRGDHFRALRIRRSLRRCAAGQVCPTPRPVKVRGDSGEFSPGHLRAFRLRRTASHRPTAIRHRTCGAPHARSQGGAKLQSYRGGNFSFTQYWLVPGCF